MSHDEAHAMNTGEKLVYMANQIASFFKAMPHDEAVPASPSTSMISGTRACAGSSSRWSMPAAISAFHPGDRSGNDHPQAGGRGETGKRGLGFLLGSSAAAFADSYILHRSAAVCTGASHRRAASSSRMVKVIEQPAMSSDVT